MGSERSWRGGDGVEDEEGFGSHHSQQQHVGSSPLGSMAALSEAYGDEGRRGVVSGASSRVATVVGPAIAAPTRRPGIPVSGPASTYAPVPASVAGRAGRRFVSSSTRPESILDGADTIRHDILPAASDEAVLDFASLRTAHTAFLAFVQDGLLLSSPVASSMVRSILDIGDRFAGTVRAVGWDVLPPLLTTSATAEEITEAVEERQTLVDRVKAEMDAELGRFSGCCLRRHPLPGAYSAGEGLRTRAGWGV